MTENIWTTKLHQNKIMITFMNYYACFCEMLHLKDCSNTVNYSIWRYNVNRTNAHEYSRVSLTGVWSRTCAKLMGSFQLHREFIFDRPWIELWQKTFEQHLHQNKIMITFMNYYACFCEMLHLKDCSNTGNYSIWGYTSLRWQ